MPEERDVTGERDVEVVVAGAGPSGLMLACELGLAGVRTLVVETLEQRVEQVKGGSLQPRTAELLDLRGLLEPMRDRFGPREQVGGHFAALPVPLDCTPWHTRHPYPIAVPQWAIEEALEERAASHGVRVLRGAPVTAVTQLDGDGREGDGPDGNDHDGDDREADGRDRAGGAGVVVTAGGRTVRARWLAACDGGRSTVRKLLGLPFPGRPGTYTAASADLRLTATSSLVPRRRGHMSELMRREGGHWGMLVPVGGERYRFTFGHMGPSDVTRDTPVTEQEIAEALRTVYGAETVLGGVDHADRFTDATRQLEHYSVGRVLFAGDAAHIHPPLGGQGLNLGVQDALNLGWKLAATLRGRAPRGLLDSYHAERHPVGAQVLHHTSAQRVLAGAEPGGDAAALRDIVTDLLRLPDTNRHLAGLMSGLSLRYALRGDHPLTGRRVPDADLVTGAGPTRLSALFRNGHAVLLDLAGVVPAGLRPPAHIDLVRAEFAGGPAELGAGALLLRPDGYVCWAADDVAACREGLLPAIAAHLTTE